MWDFMYGYDDEEDAYKNVEEDIDVLKTTAALEKKEKKQNFPQP